MHRIGKSADEIAAEIGRVVRDEFGEPEFMDSGLLFTAGAKVPTIDDPCNWQLVVVPPVRQRVWRLLCSAAERVRSRWDLKTSVGLRT